MKERPILFSSKMVRAILEGRKTQTRRVIKPQPEQYEAKPWGHFLGWKGTRGWKIEDLARHCPYGKSGDRLWVRESHKIIKEDIYCGDVNLRPKGVYYRATDKYLEDPVWTPSIHMPRWASRITLEIKNIRVERVQDISENESWKEGAPVKHIPFKFPRADIWFLELWDSINKKRGYGWDVNPWVWVIEFEVVK